MNVEDLLLNLSAGTLGLSLLFTAAVLLNKKQLVKTVTHGNPVPTSERYFTLAGNVWMIIQTFALVFISVAIISRITVTGRGPFSSMYEFSIAFSWGIIVMSLIFSWHYKIISVGAFSVVIAILLLVFANSVTSKVSPLIPALQQNVLLSVHVASAIIAYGALAVGFASSVLNLLKRNRSSLQSQNVLDRISYTTMIIGFPFLTLTIVLGAVWANIAWGRPWGWDPKETASLVTWLIFAGYLHARVLKGWKGKKSALLLVAGFIAIVFTFFGNYMFNGLHSYL